MANFYDLDPTQTKSSDGKYIDLVFTGLVPDTDYGFTFAWVYEDPKLGVSGESNIFNFTTMAEPELLPPHFTEDDLYAINSNLYINWDGKDSNLVTYDPSKLKQVNVWIKGGDFGEQYVLYGKSFTKAGKLQITATQTTTYCVKLQAESYNNKTSTFSDAFCVTLLKQPCSVYDVEHEWGADASLTILWKFDPTLDSSTCFNKLADQFAIQLIQPPGGGINSKDGTWWTAVDQDKIPPLKQKRVISADDLKQVFGELSALNQDYDVIIYVRDKNLQTSPAIQYSLSKYVDPLTPPVITVTKAPMAYNVAYTANSAFDKIYVYESLDNGATWNDSSPFSTSANPAYIATTNSLPRLVKARFSKRFGGFTDYSNIVTVTPDKIDPTDTTPPSVPTVTAGTPTYNTIPITITTSDTSTKGYRIRYKISTDTLYSPDTVLYSGASTSHTIKDLDPNKTYQISAAAYDGANNTSDYSSTITATTAATVVPVVSSLTLSVLSYGIYATWNAPSSPTVPIDKYKIELYDSSNTLLQTSYSFTTVISFSGLKASTTYYVKVNAIDITGASGNQTTSSNITLNAAGGSSDGSAPSSSPTPTVTSLYQALEVKWSAISNTDLVTYEVHVSTTNNFTASSSTKAVETKGTFAIIKTLPGTSTSLTYGTTYYVKIIAKDFDGSAAASTQASAQTLQIDNGDLATDSVRANVIKAGTITATEINSDSLLVGKLFKVGAGASDTYAVKIDASGSTTKLYSGAGIYSDSGTPFYLDTTGKFSLQDRLYFSSGTLTVKGAIDATSGTISGAITLNNGTMKIGGNVNSTYDGIYINANSYWYSTGLFSIGTSTEKFLEWTGTALKVKGEITAQSGSITGNLNVTSPGSIIAGTVGGPRVQINSTGLFAYGNILVNGSPVLTETTQIIGNATTNDPTFITTKALIGNWTVNPTSISSPNSNIVLDSSASTITATSGSYSIKIQPTNGVDGKDVVFRSGLTSSNTPNFRVTADGTLYASGAEITGKITATTGSSLGGLLDDTAKIFYQDEPPTSTASYTLKKGDAWVDTNDSKKLYIWDTSLATPAWVLAQDSAAAKSIAEGKNKTYYAGGTTSPTGVTGAVTGDLWINTSNGNKPYRYNGSTWDLVQDSGAADGAAAKTSIDSRLGTGLDSSLLKSLIVQTDGAHIYSSYVDQNNVTQTKSLYSSDSTPGFFIGWDKQATKIFPAFNIGNSTSYVKFSAYTGVLEVKGAIKATSGSFDGNVTAGGGAITIGPNGISTTSGKFSIDAAGNASFGGTLNANQITAGTFSGDRISGGVIIGSTIKTNASGYLGILQLNSSDNSLEFLNSAGTSTLGKIYSFNSGSELILQNGGTQYLGYPTNTSYMSLNSTSVRLGLIGNNAVTTDTLTIDASGAIFTGGYVRNETSNSLTWASMRNISAWSGIAPDANTNLGTTFTGDIYIQY